MGKWNSETIKDRASATMQCRQRVRVFLCEKKKEKEREDNAAPESLAVLAFSSHSKK